MTGSRDRGSELAVLDAQIARAQARIEQLDRERGQLEHDLVALREKRDGIARAEAVSHTQYAPSRRSAADKVTLFRSLFAGRTDVFPKHWHNPKTDRKGYSPACSNEWVWGVCDKPRVECGECPNQAFIPVTDRVMLDHLQGRHVAGVYPMMDDETCHFLAVDFDKDGWKEDVAAFVETCQRFAAFRRGQPVPRTKPGTVSALLARADELRLVREEAEAKQAEKDRRRAKAARKRHLATLAKQGNKAWTRLERLIEERKYDEAVTLTVDLRDTAVLSRRTDEFETRIAVVSKEHSRRRGYLDRLKGRLVEDRGGRR